MGSNAENALAVFNKTIGDEEGPSEWMEIDQTQVNNFADCTHDHQFIHVDPERAAQTPFGGPIAHGFLTLSLLPALQGSLSTDPEALKGVAMGINYGLDKVRFPSPVRVGKRVRAKRELIGADLVAGGSAVQAKYKVTIEIEGEGKPACVAEALTRFIYS
ncbi:MAG: MaoC family dehydratase [Myxococcota bacterium]|nr:MaoC family dehydratase [Myxococcota bacterium]